MKTDEALRLALEALEADELAMIQDKDGHMVYLKDQAITAIKAALEAKDEPWEQFYPEMGKPKLAYLSPTELPENYCYILPQHTWVGLTDEEIWEWFRDNTALTNESGIRIYQAIEAKLKEKNT
jgi:hypothetical protein